MDRFLGPAVFVSGFQGSETQPVLFHLSWDNSESCTLKSLWFPHLSGLQGEKSNKKKKHEHNASGVGGKEAPVSNAGSLLSAWRTFASRVCSNLKSVAHQHREPGLPRSSTRRH